MTKKIIGTIIHGALGDCYEQLLAIRKLRNSCPNTRWIAFFAVRERLAAMKHFELDMLDEIYLADEIEAVAVDEYYQFQVRDIELRHNIIDKLPVRIKAKFDLNRNIKPWQFIRTHDFNKSGLELNLSKIGRDYAPVCMEANDIDPSIFERRFTIGYLWRYRAPGGAFKTYLQRSDEWVLATKGALFNRLIDEYNAHIIISGMKKTARQEGSASKDILDKAGVVEGEYMSKYSERTLEIPEDRCTYLKGLGYAAEMEIMSRCDLLIMMPSGFSEALWMKRKTSVVLVDPPPDYMMRLTWNRMPLFCNRQKHYLYYNLFVKHSAENVIEFLEKKNLLARKNARKSTPYKKLLIISNLFPNVKEPARGMFNKQQFAELAKLCNLQVVAPLPWYYNEAIPQEENIEGIKTYHYRYFMIPKICRSLYGFFFYISLLSKIKRLYQEFKFDAILTTWAYPDAFGSYLIARVMKKPIFVKVHGTDINLYTRYFLRRKMIVWALSNSDKVIAVSGALKEEMVKIGVPSGKIVVIPNGVNTELFRPIDQLECRRNLDLPLDKKIVLYVGNLVTGKGLDTLLSAFERLNSGALLVLVGDGPLMSALCAKTKELGVENNVIFTGRKTHDVIRYYINSCDIFCLPSTNEGCPNVILEALSCGKPVVASRVGGIPDIVTSDDYGLLVEKLNHTQLAASLKLALDATWDRQKIRDHVIKFNWKDNARELLDNITKSGVANGKRKFGNLKDSVKALVSFFVPKSVFAWKGKSRDKKIALTFDDGPNPEITPKVLDILRKNNAKATFFLIGREAEKYSEIVRDIAKDGHCVGAHSYTHPRLSEIGAQENKNEIDKSVDMVENILNSKCTVYRPPRGEFSIRQIFHCLRKGLVTAFWSLDSRDSNMKHGDDIVANVVGGMNGDIILFHDDNALILNALPKVINHFRSKGFELVTVEEILK